MKILNSFLSNKGGASASHLFAKIFTSPRIGNVLFVLILLGFAYFIVTATNKIEYNWRWKDVPGYIVYNAEKQYRAAFSGTIEVDSEGGISVVRSDGSRAFVVSDLEPLKPAGSTVFTGEVIAQERIVKLGVLMIGLLTTLKISSISIILAIIIGIVAGLMRISPICVLRKLSITYVEVIRGTPLLVQIFLLYFFFGKIFNLNETQAGIAALSIFTGAFVAEIVRAGVQSVPRGQSEAARSLGMSYLQTMAYIVLPQALKRSMPPMAGQFISLIKDSSLVSVIAITDLTRAGRDAVSSSMATFEIWFTVAVIYLVVTAALSFVINRFELKMMKSD